MYKADREGIVIIIKIFGLNNLYIIKQILNIYSNYPWR